MSLSNRVAATTGTGSNATGLKATDPDLEAIFTRFISEEVVSYGKLDAATRAMVTLASNIATHSQNQYRMTLENALHAGVTPIKIKEILYQSVAYAGMAKARDFIAVTNEVLTAQGVQLPLESQSVTTPANRFEKGLALQKAIFGEQIDEMRASAPQKNLILR